MDTYINHLEQNTTNLLETVKGYSSKKLTAKSGSEWSVFIDLMTMKLALFGLIAKFHYNNLEQ